MRQISRRLDVTLRLQPVKATVVHEQPRWLVGVTSPTSVLHAMESSAPTRPGERHPLSLCLRTLNAVDPAFPFERIEQGACKDCVAIIEGHRRRPELDDPRFLEIRA